MSRLTYHRLSLFKQRKSNAAKGHEGEQQVMKLLEEYMPLVKRSYDHHHANETGKNAVGHSADIGITCNGIDVLIEVKNSDYPIRKKEIEKAERDLQEQPTARLLVLISWHSRFQKERHQRGTHKSTASQFTTETIGKHRT